MVKSEVTGNIDEPTVRGFGEEWSVYDQTALSDDELQQMFDRYFGIFPFDQLSSAAEGFDLGCGSGRWAALVAPRVGKLHCIDPSEKALAVARRRMAEADNVDFHLASVEAIPLADGSQDFCYSLGVLHHVPDTERAVASCVRKLKPGAPFLVYLYYSLDNRPAFYRLLWLVSDVGRSLISRLPFKLRKATSAFLAAIVYFPMARAAALLEASGMDVAHFPLSAYRHSSFYTMRTDALDRFGTRLEHRFSRAEIQAIMERCGLRDIVFSEHIPYWVACGHKAADGDAPAGDVSRR